VDLTPTRRGENGGLTVFMTQQGVPGVNDQELHSRISRITTVWTLVAQAHRGEAGAAAQAQQVLLERYSGAIYRYLVAVLRDPDAADEVFQEFALRFVRGYFRNADPERGRFRDFVKKSLSNLIVDHRKKMGCQPRPLATDSNVPAATDPDPGNLDEEFTGRWREELLTRTWEALAAVEAKTNQPYHTVLRLRAAQSQLSSAAMAGQLTAELGRPFSDAGVRQILHRAREKFADLLLEEVAHSLQTSAPGRLEEELAELNLLSYCRTAVERRARKS
jgi:RNA polymerase sigma-70 factor (ECF subfamily)